MGHSANNEGKVRVLNEHKGHLLAQLEEVQAQIEECSNSELANDSLGKQSDAPT